MPKYIAMGAKPEQGNMIDIPDGCIVAGSLYDPADGKLTVVVLRPVQAGPIDIKFPPEGQEENKAENKEP